jgi:hypothetical protein
MKLDLYTYCYNDEAFMPFFLDYYLPVVDRITFIDNGSTDKTIKIIKNAAVKNGPVIRLAESGMTFWDWDYGLVIRNNIWKDSDYDLMMWADLDEIIYKPDLRKFLENSKFDIYQTEGFDMVSKKFPKKGSNILDIKTGIRAGLEDKFLIWRRGSKIESVTAHSIKDTKEKVCKGQIKCLHYKYLGVDIMVHRAADIKARVPKESYCHGIKGNILDVYPSFVKTREEYEKEIESRLKLATKVI